MNGQSETMPQAVAWYRRLPWWGWVVAVILFVLVLFVGFMAVYSGRVLPGVSADGVYLGGLTKAQAEQAITSGTVSYENDQITVSGAGVQTTTVTPAQLGVSYDAQSGATQAEAYGRQGSWLSVIHQQLRALLGRPTTIASYNFDDSKLLPWLSQLEQSATVPVANATLTANSSGATVAPAVSGQQLDTGQLIYDIGHDLVNQSTAAITLPEFQIAPQITTANLQTASTSVSTLLSAPVTLDLSNGVTKTISPAQIATWVQASRSEQAASETPAETTIRSFYPYADLAQQPVTVGLNTAAVQNYTAQLASSIDTSPVNAQLDMNNGQVSVFAPSSNGYQLDQNEATTAILKAVTAQGSDRTADLTVNTLTPAVTESSLNNLGINQLISEGYTTFPAGPANRLQNIRAGASKFNDMLVAPGQEVSVVNTIGPIDAAHGFAEGLVIDNGTEEDAFGGGLCQVSTTMYRAALLAGLPINARTNHSFVVSYYTSFQSTILFGPHAGTTYSADVPGLDATIFQPSPDLKFTNDTGHYILIQAVYTDTSLKFDFYGTATKYAVIRGPYAVSGDPSNPNVASTTVFYRDIYDMSGNLIHTDTVTTSYQSDISYLPKSL